MTKISNEQDAIKQAVEAGYRPYDVKMYYRFTEDVTGDLREHEHPFWSLDCLFTDPAFWQALGKARRWSDISKFGDINFERLGVHPGWLTLALRYFEVKLSGGDLNQFWTSLP
ncbi:MAG TPA: hypothetical protein VLC46_26765 [Thermoanaerobaculia bacterium]|jgi:hypothetical protein|nr:hypothetical protein [Thermoanaerobaculia bacterium]